MVGEEHRLLGGVGDVVFGLLELCGVFRPELSDPSPYIEINLNHFISNRYYS